MSLINYTSLNAEVTALIRDLGLPITVQRIVVGTNDLATVGKGYGVVTPKKNKLTTGEQQSSPVQIKGLTMYATATSKFDPQPGDYVLTKTEKWQVINVEVYNPAATKIAFKLELQ